MFVRCRGGVSHRPDESVTDSDLNAAVQSLDQFLDSISEEAVS